MKDSKERAKIRGRIHEWMGRTTPWDLNKSLIDAAILETFFYVYQNLNEGMSIHDIGKEIGVLPLP